MIDIHLRLFLDILCPIIFPPYWDDLHRTTLSSVVNSPFLHSRDFFLWKSYFGVTALKFSGLLLFNYCTLKYKLCFIVFIGLLSFLILLYVPTNATSLSQLSCLSKIKTPFLAELHIVHLSFLRRHVLIIYTKFWHISIPGSWGKNPKSLSYNLGKRAILIVMQAFLLSDTELPHRSFLSSLTVFLSQPRPPYPHTMLLGLSQQ